MHQQERQDRDRDHRDHEPARTAKKISRGHPGSLVTWSPGLDYRRYLLTSLVTYTDWWSVLSPSQPGQCQAVTPILSADSASPRRYGFHMNPGVTKQMGMNPTSDTSTCSAAWNIPRRRCGLPTMLDAVLTRLSDLSLF